MKHWVASRQIGKTHAVALEASIIAALGKTGPLCGSRALIVSKDDDTSKEVLRECVKWIRVLQGSGIVSFVGDPTKSRIRLSNDCEIVSIPGGRDEAIRGPNGSVWLDEFAFHPSQEDNWTAAAGVTTRGGLLRITGTPLRDNDLFWDIRVNREGRWGAFTRHLTTIHDAIEYIVKPTGEPLTLQELHNKVPLFERFACEYECVPLSDVLAYFTLELIDRCVALYDPEFKGGHLYGGYDVAFSPKGDLSAIVSVRRQDERYQCERVELAVRGMKDPDDQENYAAKIFKDGEWVRMCVDEGGVGYGVANRLKKRLGSARCEPVTLSLEENSVMFTDLHELMEQGRLALPPDDNLRMDLYSVKREFTQTGKQKFSADVTDRGHADRAWALALAVRAAGTRSTPAVTPTASGSRTWGDSWGGIFGDRSGF